MRPVPNQFNQGAFVGKRVEQLRIGIHQWTLQFGEGYLPVIRPDRFLLAFNVDVEAEQLPRLK